MVQASNQLMTAYQAALHGVVYFNVSEAGLLRVEGSDQIAFLQRQTTNDVQLLRPTRSIVTVLVNASARILDVLRLISDEAGINLVTLPGFAASTYQFLKSRIFFMDKVSLSDLSQAYVQVELDGPQAGAFLSKLGFDHVPELDETITISFHDFPLQAIGRPGLSGIGYLLLAPARQAQETQTFLAEQGAYELSPEIYHLLRVEAGLPGAGAELSQQFTPLEAGLAWAVSAEKGCYTGQEVIARQITYDKITQHLVGLRLEAAVSPGEKLWGEGKPAGVVTSIAASPQFDLIALAVVRRPFHSPGSLLSAAATPESAGVQAKVVPLPFRSQGAA